MNAGVLALAGLTRLHLRLPLPHQLGSMQSPGTRAASPAARPAEQRSYPARFAAITPDDAPLTFS